MPGMSEAGQDLRPKHMVDNGMVDDHLLAEMGLGIWNLAYRGGRSDADAAETIVKNVELFDGMIEESLSHGEPWMWARFVMAAGKWADQGYPKLVTPHKFAAALMSTSVRAEDVGDLEVPWTAFLVIVPDKLLSLHGIEIVRILVAIYKFDRPVLDGRMSEPGTRVHLQISGTRIDTCLRYQATDLADLLKDEEVDGDVGDEEQRVFRMCRRLVAGLLLTMQHTDNFKVREKAHGPHGDGRDGPPPHRVAFIGAPIVVDCRASVREYVAGRRVGAPSVQVMVRGHYKRQVIGIGRTGRKVIWVQPYWRGPEDAPILTHPYRVG